MGRAYTVRWVLAAAEGTRSGRSVPTFLEGLGAGVAVVAGAPTVVARHANPAQIILLLPSLLLSPPFALAPLLVFLRPCGASLCLSGPRLVSPACPGPSAVSLSSAVKCSWGHVRSVWPFCRHIETVWGPTRAHHKDRGEQNGDGN